MSLEEHDVERDEPSRAEQPVNLPPPPFVPVGPAHDVKDEEPEAEEREDAPLRRTG